MTTTTVVADLVCEMHAEELRGVSDVLSRYVGLVRKVADGKSLTADEAASAAAAVFELRLPPDRFDRDVSAMRTVLDLDKRIAEDANAVMSREANDAERDKLAQLERAVTEQKLRMRRFTSLAMERQTRRSHRDELVKASPHLFRDAVTLTDNEWTAVRH
jgi:hypothetical protein